MPLWVSTNYTVSTVNDNVDSYLRFTPRSPNRSGFNAWTELWLWCKTDYITYSPVSAKLITKTLPGFIIQVLAASLSLNLSFTLLQGCQSIKSKFLCLVIGQSSIVLLVAIGSIAHASAQAVERLYCRVIGGKSSNFVSCSFWLFFGAKQLLEPFANKLKKLFPQEMRRSFMT